MEGRDIFSFDALRDNAGLEVTVWGETNTINAAAIQRQLTEGEYQSLSLKFTFFLANARREVKEEDFPAILETFQKLGHRVVNISILGGAESDFFTEQQLVRLLGSALNLIRLQLPIDMLPFPRPVQDHLLNTLEEIHGSHLNSLEGLKAFSELIERCSNIKKASVFYLDADNERNFFDCCKILGDLRSNTLKSISFTLGNTGVNEAAFLKCLGMFFARRQKSIDLTLNLWYVRLLHQGQTGAFVEKMKLSPPKSLFFFTAYRPVPHNQFLYVFEEMSRCMKGPGSEIYLGSNEFLYSQDAARKRFLQALARTRVRSLDLFSLGAEVAREHLCEILGAFSQNTTTTSLSIRGRLRRDFPGIAEHFDAICRRNEPTAKLQKLIDQSNICSREITAPRNNYLAGLWPSALKNFLQHNHTEYTTLAYKAVQYLSETRFSDEGGSNRKRPHIGSP